MRKEFSSFSADKITGGAGGATLGGFGYPVFAHPANNNETSAVKRNSAKLRGLFKRR